MAVIKFIAIHHSGPPSSFNYTFQQIDDFHRQKWGMRSTLGKYGGYNLAINPQGQMTQFRAIGEETVAQRGYNFNTVSICLIGDFNKDQPTWQQKAKLKNVLLSLIQKRPETQEIIMLKDTILDIKITDIHPHRWFQPGTDCNGLRLKDTWVQDVVLKEYLDEIAQLQLWITRLLQQLKMLKLGGAKQGIPCHLADNKN